MDEITPEQKQKLSNWAVQRDSTLNEIAVETDKHNRLLEANRDLADSNTEISDRIQQSVGRIDELKKKEKELGDLLSSEVAALKEEKSGLENRNDGLKTEIKLWEEKKESLLRDIENLSAIHDKIFEKVNGLESLVGGIVKVSSENAAEINKMFTTASETLQKVVDVAERNVEKTNKLILDVPKIIVDIHKDVIERKTLAKNRTP